MDFGIAPIIGACYNASKIEALLLLPESSVARAKRSSSSDVRWLIPTYYGGCAALEALPSSVPEFGEPMSSICASEADGLRIILGAKSYEEIDKPDIKIERRPRGWAIVLHPLGGGDPSGVVFFLDDGRSFLQRELMSGVTPLIQDINDIESVSELDELDHRPDGASDDDFLNGLSSTLSQLCAAIEKVSVEAHRDELKVILKRLAALVRMI